ncbi:hypothetical protein LMG28688_00272 [Paraburkholderia caffeinitolerans]|uniref:Uncharacterized protein n=1 Tax=Paraburkholderia caffeinitolerans TaxID=1723730 RepID=A0A6J5FFI4_9BURK|nr:hypothetical protein LMG28688_00272 [Paraburkholderia caffeinitolerans]
MQRAALNEAARLLWCVRQRVGALIALIPLIPLIH